MYIDGCLPWHNDPSKFSRLVEYVYKLGYQAAIINFPSAEEYKKAKKEKIIITSPEVSEFPISFRTLLFYKGKYPIPLIPMITVRAENEKDLKKRLSKVIDLKTLVMVDSLRKEVLEIAARDGRVDCIAVYDAEHVKVLSKGILSLIRQNNVTISISIKSILHANNALKARILRDYYKLFKQFKVSTNRYSIGSYAESVWDIRGPIESISVLNAFLDVPYVWAKKMAAFHNENLVFRWINRDLGLFIEPDVYIIDKKKGD